MPSEIRHVLFRPNEVVVAIAEFYRRMQTPLPPGSVVRTTLEERAGRVGFGMTVLRDDGGARQDVLMEGSQLASALILYCRDHRIPLPSDSEKTLQKIDDWLALVVTRNPRQDAMPTVDAAVLAAARAAALTARPSFAARVGAAA